MIRRAASRQCLPRHARKPHEAPPIDWPRRRCAAGGLARPTTGNTGPAGRPPRGLVISRPRSWVPCGVPRIPHPGAEGRRASGNSASRKHSGRRAGAPAGWDAAPVQGQTRIRQPAACPRLPGRPTPPCGLLAGDVGPGGGAGWGGDARPAAAPGSTHQRRGVRPSQPARLRGEGTGVHNAAFDARSRTGAQPPRTCRVRGALPAFVQCVWARKRRVAAMRD